MTTIVSIDAVVTPLAEEGAVTMDGLMRTVRENQGDGAAFQNAVARFQAAMGISAGGCVADFESPEVVAKSPEVDVQSPEVVVQSTEVATLPRSGVPAASEGNAAAAASSASLNTLTEVTANRSGEDTVSPPVAPVGDVHLDSPASAPRSPAVATLRKGGASAAPEQDAAVTAAPPDVPLVIALDVPVGSVVVQPVAADVKTAAVDAASVRTQVLADAVEAVCDAILVSPGILRGQGEMMVRLKPEVLSGTEIHIEAKGSTLTVAFNPATADVAEILSRNLAQFEQHLAGRIRNYQIAAKIKGKEELKG